MGNNATDFFKDRDGICTVVDGAVCDHKDGCSKCVFALSRLLEDSIGSSISKGFSDLNDTIILSDMD